MEYDDAQVSVDQMKEVLQEEDYSVESVALSAVDLLGLAANALVGL